MSVPAIGIDLGTAYSCVSVFQHGKVEIIVNDHGNRKTPSCVTFTKTEILTGEDSNYYVTMNPTNTAFSTQRLIGKNCVDSFVQSDIQHWPFEVVSDEGKPKIKVEYKSENKTFFPEEISSIVLTKMKKIAEAYIGNVVNNAVITVPAYFNYSQRQAIHGACCLAGLNVLRMMKSPLAAALAYGHNQKGIDEQNVLVFDLGGGTCDVSIVFIEGGIFDVKSIAGNNHLGGEDFDNQLVNHFMKEFYHKHKKDLTCSKRAIMKLRKACELAKRALSFNTQASIHIDNLFEGIDLCDTITRIKFEELNANLFRDTLKPVVTALKDAKLDKSQIDDIILIGGSTRIPEIRRLLKDFFNGKEMNTSLNPDEAVAYGAALEAAILDQGLNGPMKDSLLLDVVPFSLGIETADGKMAVLVERNTVIPINETRIITTYSDNKSRVLIKVYEGEHSKTQDNNLLGKFELTGIPLAPQKFPQIEIKFGVDANGILIVSAVDKDTGRSNQITISNRRDINEKEKNRIAAKNSLEGYAFNINYTLEESKKEVFNKVNDILKWLKDNQLAETEKIQNKQKELKAIVSHFATTISNLSNIIENNIDTNTSNNMVVLVPLSKKS